MEKVRAKRIEDAEIFRKCPQKYHLQQTIGLTKHSLDTYHRYCRERLFMAAIQWMSSKRGGERSMVLPLTSFLARMREALVAARPHTVPGTAGRLRSLLMHDCKGLRYHLPRLILKDAGIFFSNARYEIEGIRSSVQCAFKQKGKVFVARITSPDTPLRHDPSLQMDALYVQEETGEEPHLIWIVSEDMGKTGIRRVPYWGADVVRREVKALSKAIDAGIDYRVPGPQCGRCPYRKPCYGGIDASEEEGNKDS